MGEKQRVIVSRRGRSNSFGNPHRPAAVPRGAIAKLAMGIAADGPQAAVPFDEQAVGVTCGHRLHAVRDAHRSPVVT